MGQLIDGEWVTDGAKPKKPDGTFVRKEAGFRNWITKSGAAGTSGTGGFQAESGRYHIYVSYACPWAHRTLMFRALKGLADHVSFDVLHPDVAQDGWSFSTDFAGATGDTVNGRRFLRDVYTAADPDITSRVTVPVLWDKKQETIVSNESSEIIRMFNSAFDDITGNTSDHWPKKLRPAMQTVNERIYETLNNGVYRCGFARSQSAYDAAVHKVFETLDWLEVRLTTSRYLMGATLTEADWRLFATLIRFDPVYHTHFKCNRKWLREYPNLWAYTRELFQWPGISETVKIDHIVRHYHFSHESINPHRIIPINPLIDYDEPYDRALIA